MKKDIYHILPSILIPFILTISILSLCDEDFGTVFKDSRAISEAEPIEAIKGRKVQRTSGSKGIRAFPKAGEKTYKVRHGDTWWGIAHRFGVEDHKALRKHNGKKVLTPGMIIRIPREMIQQ